MPREKSAGAIVFRTENNIRYYLLLHYPPANEGKRGQWGFAKGHVEENEDEEETVRREVAEETGITSLQFEPLFRESISYSFKRDNGMVPKEVVFFLAKTNHKEVRLSSEHVGFVWLPYESAAKKLTYKNAKDILKKAETCLSL